MAITELPIPPEAETDPRARELIRVWAAHGEQHISIATGLWDDPATWGIALADLAVHVANAYQLTNGRNRGDALARIRSGFDAEWEHPTCKPKGRLLDD
jgi:hypothetical protein